MNTHLFVDMLFVVVGVLTYIFRNTPNPYIGVRLGYTYLSKEAWRRANTFAALYCILLGMLLLFLDLTIKLPNNVFVLLMLVGIAPMVVITYRIAKETYEREDMKKPMDEEPKPLRKVDVKSHLILQLVTIAAYLLVVAMVWGKLPNTVATHFNIYGIPDSFMDRLSGAIFAPYRWDEHSPSYNGSDNQRADAHEVSGLRKGTKASLSFPHVASNLHLCCDGGSAFVQREHRESRSVVFLACCRLCGDLIRVDVLDVEALQDSSLALPI